MTVNERWLPVPGYECEYEVSDWGRVRSLDRLITTKRGVVKTRKGQLKRATPAKHGGYPLVYLPRRENSPFGRAPMVKVHHLVLTAFVGPKPAGMECCHRNDVPTDNRLENLRWDTPKGNAADKGRNGGHWQARKTHCPKGHEYTPGNTVIKPSEGRRRCRICLARDARAYWARKSGKRDVA